jgi:flagellar hook-associated protein 2
MLGAFLPSHTMAGLQLSGLASNLDWKTLVDQLMDLERRPVDRLEREQTLNTTRANALTDLGVRLASLRTASSALKDASVFAARTVASSATTGAWTAKSTAGGATGAFKFTVSQLATATVRTGAADIAGPLSGSNDVSGVTLATMRTAAAATGGFFTINGQQVSVSTADSLQDVFAAIDTATSGEVTAAYDSATDRVTLTSTSGDPITLGAANDSSYFLRLMKLANNDDDTITSSGTLGALKTTARLSSAGLRAAITNVGADGAGAFSINGVAIAFNVNDDTLGSVVKRINAAGAGVSAAYDAINDRVTLTNTRAGDAGLTLSETGTGFLAATGLSTGAVTTRGVDAHFTIDDGPRQSSTGNELDAAAHGIDGLSVALTSTGTQTISVSADTTSMRGKIDAFISAYNSVQTFIDEKTRVTTANGKVTTAVLAANREVQDWARELRQLAFGSVSTGSSTLSRLEDLGLGFTGISATLAVRDEAKLTSALRDRAGDVETFFTTPTTGLAARFDSLLTRLAEAADGQKTRLNQSNTGLDRQIADLERRLAQQRELLTNSFIKMEEAQSRIQLQGSQLSSAFASNSSKS